MRSEYHTLTLFKEKDKTETSNVSYISNMAWTFECKNLTNSRLHKGVLISKARMKSCLTRIKYIEPTTILDKKAKQISSSRQIVKKKESK